MIRLVFFGSDEYSLAVLKSLAKDKRFTIVGIVTLPHAEAIQRFAEEENLSFTIFPSIIRIIEKIKSKGPEVGVLASYGKILPKKILNIPKHGILNIHPSLLPKNRGPTPVPTAILSGEKETGVTIFKMDEKVDHGPILAQFKEEIKPDETAKDLLKRLFAAGAEVLKTILPAYLEGRIKLREQNHSQATYAKKFTRKDGKIDWKKPAEDNEKFIRAMHPWPGSWTEVKLKIRNEKLKIKRLKILQAHLGKNKLVLDRVQLEGKKPVTWKQFKEGYPQAKLI